MLDYFFPKKKTPTVAPDTLYYDDAIVISSARIARKNNSYAMKYVSSVKLGETTPPRLEALITLGMSLIALLVLLYYRYSDRVTSESFTLLFFIVLCCAAIAGLILVFNPVHYSLQLTLINGETLMIKTKSEKKILKIHHAVMTAVAMNRAAKDEDQEKPILRKKVAVAP